MYIVLESQTNKDGTIGTIVTSFSDRNEAESKYHEILMYASKSALPMHTAFMLTNAGHVIKSECYEHESEVEE